MLCCQSKNALALKLQHIPTDILLVLHDNKYLNEVSIDEEHGDRCFYSHLFSLLKCSLTHCFKMNYMYFALRRELN